ncbi:hypothetical protein THAOC_05366 [Thalassiosira oceanica]|uniref:Uncharacterized protein n=1 Tax=Thalassiosira oceanica TaxID=159749 RepID=K0TMW3_THAOC|nr:hypothetical protein THAOC_05366 [Thalassiosira oceanica]|eukprot:EJK73037.1 hypothetical protein THAOC_05366 [Thalassiosira oceanica]
MLLLRLRLAETVAFGSRLGVEPLSPPRAARRELGRPEFDDWQSLVELGETITRSCLSSHSDDPVGFDCMAYGHDRAPPGPSRAVWRPAPSSPGRRANRIGKRRTPHTLRCSAAPAATLPRTKTPKEVRRHLGTELHGHLSPPHDGVHAKIGQSEPEREEPAGGGGGEGDCTIFALRAVTLAGGLAGGLAGRGLETTLFFLTCDWRSGESTVGPNMAPSPIRKPCHGSRKNTAKCRGRSGSGGRRRNEEQPPTFLPCGAVTLGGGRPPELRMQQSAPGPGEAPRLVLGGMLLTLASGVPTARAARTSLGRKIWCALPYLNVAVIVCELPMLLLLDGAFCEGYETPEAAAEEAIEEERGVSLPGGGGPDFLEPSCGLGPGSRPLFASMGCCLVLAFVTQWRDHPGWLEEYQLWRLTRRRKGDGGSDGGSGETERPMLNDAAGTDGGSGGGDGRYAYDIRAVDEESFPARAAGNGDKAGGANSDNGGRPPRTAPKEEPAPKPPPVSILRHVIEAESHKADGEAKYRTADEVDGGTPLRDRGELVAEVAGHLREERTGKRDAPAGEPDGPWRGGVAGRLERDGGPFRGIFAALPAEDEATAEGEERACRDERRPAPGDAREADDDPDRRRRVAHHAVRGRLPRPGGGRPAENAAGPARRGRIRGLAAPDAVRTAGPAVGGQAGPRRGGNAGGGLRDAGRGGQLVPARRGRDRAPDSRTRYCRGGDA